MIVGRDEVRNMADQRAAMLMIVGHDEVRNMADQGAAILVIIGQTKICGERLRALYEPKQN